MAARLLVIGLFARCWWPGGDRRAGPGGGLVGDDQAAGSARNRQVPPVAGGPEHPAGVVAAPVVAAVGSEEHVPAAAFVLAGATAWLTRMVLDLVFEHLGQKRRKVDRQTGIPVGAAVGVVLGREPVEPAFEFA